MFILILQLYIERVGREKGKLILKIGSATKLRFELKRRESQSI